jgi:hypothetical protein
MAAPTRQSRLPVLPGPRPGRGHGAGGIRPCISGASKLAPGCGLLHVALRPGHERVPTRALPGIGATGLALVWGLSTTLRGSGASVVPPLPAAWTGALRTIAQTAGRPEAQWLVVTLALTLILTLAAVRLPRPLDEPSHRR